MPRTGTGLVVQSPAVLETDSQGIFPDLTRNVSEFLAQWKISCPVMQTRKDSYSIFIGDIHIENLSIA